MKLKILGVGCPTCKKLYAEAEKAIAASGVAVELEKVQGMDEILAYNVLMTPAVVLDEVVKSSGRVPPSSEIVAWITTAAANEANG